MKFPREVSRKFHLNSKRLSLTRKGLETPHEPLFVLGNYFTNVPEENKTSDRWTLDGEERTIFVFLISNSYETMATSQACLA
jgi:hypothetical protein